MSTAVVLFTRDLRVHDNPTLQAALEDQDAVVPLFVLDDGILGTAYNRPNRASFLADSLADLDTSLKDLGAGLVVRRGATAEVVAQVVDETRADAVHVAGDVTRHARRRQQRLADALEGTGADLRVCDQTHFVVPPGRILPAGRDHMAVFTPYHRRWNREPLRTVHRRPRSLSSPDVAGAGPPSAADICRGEPSPDLLRGGEGNGRRRLEEWLGRDVGDYEAGSDDLAADSTSRLSAYLHFGCLSPTEMVARARHHGGPGAEAFVRQIAWRDFHAQVLAARPGSVVDDYRPRGDRWRDDEQAVTAWKEGTTGYPVVDAGMRQLAREGWMHNRARLVVAHFLTKTLYVDWRVGAAHFMDLLVDGDVSNNTMNWQWAAGTGTDTRPNRYYNYTSQGHRHDPEGDYVRRYVPELASVPGSAVHEPWDLPEDQRTKLAYPARIVDADEARGRFREARA